MTQIQNYFFHRRNMLYLMVLILGVTITSCYKMPSDDDYSLVPCTNNPSVTRGGSGDWSPTIGF